MDRDPETIRIIKVWKGQSHSLSVHVALWEAARDALSYFVGGKPSVASGTLEITLLARKDEKGECQIVYSTKQVLDFLKLHQLILAIGRDGNAMARRMLCEIGGLTDSWDQKDIAKLKLDMSKIMALIVLNKEGGASWDQLISYLQKTAKPTSTKPK